MVFLDQGYLRRNGIENVVDMYKIADAYDEFKLIIPPGHYLPPNHLAEEMQLSINVFEKGFLKHVNADIGVVIWWKF